jgi:caffeoyl-CoA O-methyltransferase
MDLMSDQVVSYLKNLVPERHPEMMIMEEYARKENFPIIGPVCGYLCYQLTRMIKARKVFELGSGYGYSTAWFARAVQENGGGIVHHAVWDESLSGMARVHLKNLGFDKIIEYHVGEAVAELEDINDKFDLIFNDINKEGYPASLPVIKDKLRSGGILITDNILWHGQVFDEGDHEKSTEGVRDFTQKITSDGDWIVTLIPIRDGLIVALKK